MSKLTQVLLAANAKREQEKVNAKYDAAIAELAVKREEANALGLSNEEKRIERIEKQIWLNLRHMHPDVKWVDSYFYEGEITLNEDGTVYQSYSWRRGRMQSSYRIDIHHHTVYSNTGGYLHSRNTGKVNLKIGPYDNSQLFKQLKDGGYKYYEIASVLSRFIHQEMREKAAAAVRKSQEHVAAELTEELKLERYGAVQLVASSNVDKPIYLCLQEIKQHMTVEQARALVLALQAAGIGYYKK